jgi:hypothetical protein
MFKGLTISVLLTLSCVHSTLSAQQSAPRPLKTLCVSEKETGFNWVSGDWVQTNFKAGEKLLIQKIVEPTPYCKADTTPSSLSTKGCYQIKVLGSPPSFLDFPDECDEISEKNSLKVVHCRKISFQPDGRFIRLPWHADIFENPKNNTKDSLVLAVGKCSRIVE